MCVYLKKKFCLNLFHRVIQALEFNMFLVGSSQNKSKHKINNVGEKKLMDNSGKTYSSKNENFGFLVHVCRGVMDVVSYRSCAINAPIVRYLWRWGINSTIPRVWAWRLHECGGCYNRLYIFEMLFHIWVSNGNDFLFFIYFSVIDTSWGVGAKLMHSWSVVNKNPLGWNSWFSFGRVRSFLREYCVFSCLGQY